VLLKDQIALWRDRFYGRQEAFGQKISYTKEGDKMVSHYSPVFKDKKAKTVAGKFEPLRDEHVEGHIKGFRELLIYVLQTNGSCHFAALDFDLAHSFEDVLACSKAIESDGFPAAIARSTRKGHHIYLFFDEAIEGRYVISYIRHVYQQVGFMAQLENEGKALPETFPKTIALRDDLSTGYGIKPPMQGQGMGHNQNCWVNDQNEPIGGKGNADEQWTFFDNIPKITKASLLDFLEKNKVPVEEIRMHEKRGAVKQRDYRRTTPYSSPKDGDLMRVVNGCPAMKKQWDLPPQQMNHQARVAVLSWALYNKNGIDVVREKFGSTPQTEMQIEYAKDTCQKAWTCRALQEHGVCIKNTHPQFEGTHCFKKIAPREMINGKLVINPKKLPETEWPDPSPIRLRVEPPKKESPADIKGAIQALDKDDKDLPGKISNIMDRIVKLRKSKGKEELYRLLKDKKLMGVRELKRFEKEAKDFYKREQKKEAESSTNSEMINGTLYARLPDQGYSLMIPDEDGNYQTQAISNFEIVIDKDVNVVSEFRANTRRLQGHILCKGKQTDFDVTGEEWSSNSKLKTAITNSAGPGAAVRKRCLEDVVECASFFALRNTVLENLYEDNGFDDNKNPSVFRSKELCITRDGIISGEDAHDLVYIQNAGGAQYLGLSHIDKEDFNKAVNCIKNDLIGFQHPEISIPMVAHSLQAAIQNAFLPFKEAPVLWIQGLTGTNKSEIARMVQDFHGDFHALVNFSSTSKAIEFYSCVFKDAVMVLDDFKSGQHRHINMSALIQNFYDRSARGRLQKASSAEEDVTSRGLVMVTSEDDLTEASSIARTLYLEAQKVDKLPGMDDRLANLKDNRHLFSGVTARFIHYMMINYKNEKDLAPRFSTIRKTLTEGHLGKQNVHRIMQNLTANYLTWELFCEFLYAEGMMTKEEKAESIETHWRTVDSLKYRMLTICQVNQACQVFLNALHALVGSGEVYIEGIGVQRKFAKCIGFIKDNDSSIVYLYPSVCAAKAKELVFKEGGIIFHSTSAIGKQMIEDRIIVDKDKDRTQKSIRHNGGMVKVWALDGKLSGFVDDGEEKKEKPEEDNVINMASF